MWRRRESICGSPTPSPGEPPGGLGLIVCTPKLEALQRSPWLARWSLGYPSPRTFSEGLSPETESHPGLNPPPPAKHLHCLSLSIPKPCPSQQRLFPTFLFCVSTTCQWSLVLSSSSCFIYILNFSISVRFKTYSIIFLTFVILLTLIFFSFFMCVYMYIFFFSLFLESSFTLQWLSYSLLLFCLLPLFFFSLSFLFPLYTPQFVGSWFTGLDIRP